MKTSGMKTSKVKTSGPSPEDRVREVVCAIPPGEAMSYGEVAVLAGIPSGLMVGRIMARIDGVPWHRVLRADGTPAPHLAERQIALLEAEGVRFENGKLVR